MLITLNQAVKKIQAANKILLTAHILPDGDAVGSTPAMLQILRSIVALHARNFIRVGHVA